jgi:hypothetical protein
MLPKTMPSLAGHVNDVAILHDVDLPRVFVNTRSEHVVTQ